jgi:dihydroorotate dehydrogenase electron transfer subunit
VDLLLKDLISKGEILFSDSLFFLCGPYGMLKALSFLPHDITYVSMEGMMACGFGICMGCAVKKRNKRGYFRTCTEGPAFKLKDIEL